MARWLDDKLNNLEESQLEEMFREICRFRKTGLLEGKSRLRDLEREFSDNVSHTPYGDCMRLVEDAVLFEISRRFFLGRRMENEGTGNSEMPG